MGNLPEMMLAAELRCHCIQTVTGLMLPKRLANVEIIPKGPHCNAVEIIATLKNSQQICLDPQAKWVKMIINRILHSASKERRQ
ncbi:C-X-C motif chemokine 5-like [Aquila chrysaetos chrysaetos]|uniref:C-X-C motif chemokine 5-like n=1 Tax=Aquila chrysaetos chrysaetos TaxID=223781 RepID=UPI0011771D68|nr:C-X-C motif chemokine 5-like [Aquila chrysaetos chrysaetos]